VLECGSRITAAAFWNCKPVLALASGSIKIFDGSKQIASLQAHAGAVTGVDVHPSGTILASVGSDKSYAVFDLTDLENSQPVARVYGTSGEYYFFFASLSM
jgi:pre-mRNA-processing factor 19